MSDFELDARLRHDCHIIGRLEFCQLLLLNTAAVPWFVLVPETHTTEIIDLDPSQRLRLWAETDEVAEFVRSNFPVEKLNIAAIGNVVSQLHVHVVGRHCNDYCWPDVVWGRVSDEQYTAERVAEITALVQRQLPVRG